MKFTVSSVLVAALATLSSAAVIPSAAAATALPQKFTLVVSPSTSGTPLDTESTQITVDANFPQRFNLGPSQFTQANVVVTKEATKDTFHITFFNGLTTADLSLNNHGEVFFNFATRDTTPEGRWSQLNGGLAFDAKDGKGAQALWKACDQGNASSRWSILFNPPPPAFYEGPCFPVSLKVVAL